jgi:hypothetical protein
MPDYQESDLCFIRLHRAGWSSGSVVTAQGTWIVIRANGENVIHAEGATETEAWQRAFEQAGSLSILGRWFWARTG